jgi:hypothetical protein
VAPPKLRQVALAAPSHPGDGPGRAVADGRVSPLRPMRPQRNEWPLPRFETGHSRTAADDRDPPGANGLAALIDGNFIDVGATEDRWGWRDGG